MNASAGKFIDGWRRRKSAAFDLRENSSAGETVARTLAQLLSAVGAAPTPRG